MKRTYFLKAKQALVVVMMAAATMFVACDSADDVDDPGKDPGKEEPNKPDDSKDAVKLDAPTLAELVRGEGEETATLTVEWGYVANATAYLVNVVKTAQVTETGIEEANEAVGNFTDYQTDRTKVEFNIAYGGEYKITVASVGDGKEYTNSDAAEAEYFWYVAPTTVAAGDLATTLPALLAEAEGEEVTFALVAGEEYTLNAPVDFGAYRVTVKSMANVGTAEEPVIVENGEHAVVVLGEAGVLRHGNALTVKNISFDCTNQNLNSAGVAGEAQYSKAYAPIEGSHITPENGTPTNGGHPAYVLTSVTMDGCYFKNVKAALYSVGGQVAWALNTLTVNNCVVQCANDGSTSGDVSIIDFYCYGYYEGELGRYVGVKDINITNSTIFNTEKNTKNNRFIRFTNNGVLKDMYGSNEAKVVFNNNTLSNVFAWKEFGNNTPNDAAYEQTFTNNIVVDCFRLSKYFQGNCTKTIANNIGWWTGTYADNEGENSEGEMPQDAGIFSDENTSAIKNPNLTGLGVLDFAAEDGLGIKVSASGAAAGQGDPRWN